MSFIAAIRFLTIFPALPQRQTSNDDVARSMVFFPLVGLIIGLILAGAYWVTHLIMPSSVAGGLVVVLAAVLSGGMHLDGLMDTFDGIGGIRSPETRIKAMKDSRAGAFGVIAAVLLLMMKYLAIAAVPDTTIVFALILMPVLSRWAMVYAIFAHPYANPSGMGTVLKQGADRRRFILATAIALAVALPLFKWAGLVIMLGVWLTALGMSTYLKGKLGGLTGDTYGAINEAAAVSAIMTVLLLSYNQWLGLGA